MKTEFFPHFMRMNFPLPEILKMPNEELIEIGEEFKTYLLKTFNNDTKKLEDIWDIRPETVVMNQVKRDPFKMNGYHPALILHFTQFAKANP